MRGMKAARAKMGAVEIEYASHDQLILVTTTPHSVSNQCPPRIVINPRFVIAQPIAIVFSVCGKEKIIMERLMIL
jgi:hypothetical protein